MWKLHPWTSSNHIHFSSAEEPSIYFDLTCNSVIYPRCRYVICARELKWPYNRLHVVAYYDLKDFVLA